VPEALAVTGHDLVERIGEPRHLECSERTSHRPRQPEFGQEHNAAAGVTCNRSPVTENEPPAFEPGIFGDACEQAAGLLVVQRKQRQLFVSVEPDGDPRRPPAELSGAVIEHHRAKELHAAL
jgi:hypothetical protein